MDRVWELYGLPPPQTEIRFHPTRKWRFDYAWPEYDQIAVEIEGGIWSGGRHVRGKGYLGDLHKYNEAARLGWRVFRFTPQQVKTGEAQSYMRTIFFPLLDPWDAGTRHCHVKRV